MSYIFKSISFLKTHLLALMAGIIALLAIVVKIMGAKNQGLKSENKANETTIDAFKKAYKARTARDEVIRKAGQDAIDNPDFMNQDRL